MDFRQWFEQQSAADLPPIPNGMIRLTHFTQKHIAEKLVSGGEPFKYGGRGMISGSTDSFSDNEVVRELIQTGKTGAWDRNSFGNTVVLIDMPQDHFAIHNSAYNSPGEVANEQIVGYFDRESQMFVPNQRYNPSATELQAGKTLSHMQQIRNQARSQASQLPPPQPQPNQSTVDDTVW